MDMTLRLNQLFQKQKNKTKPTVIIANTIKGKGNSFMENNILWHYRYPHEGVEYTESVLELLKKKPKGLKSLEKDYL